MACTGAACDEVSADGPVLPPCLPPLPPRWAVGVLIYELCNGLPPFYHEDRLQMYQKIVAAKYTFPATFSKVGTLVDTHSWCAAWLGHGQM